MRRRSRLGLLLVAGAAFQLACGARQTPAGDAGADAAVDVRTPDAHSADRAIADLLLLDRGADIAAPDLNLAFPAVLEGVWLIGWSGGMNHFSWVRFAQMSTPSMTKKDAWILAGQDISANLPFWSCSGKATYWMGAAAQTIYLDFPSSACLPGGSSTGGYIFDDFDASGAGAPQDAILSATVQVQSTLEKYVGYKFPDAWCDQAMTSCKAPW